LLKTYIECKAYKETKKVPLSDVAKFKEVLTLNNISHARIFITTSTYSPRANKIGIKCIDGSQLKRLERWSYVQMLFRWTFYVLVSMEALHSVYIYIYYPKEFLIYKKKWKDFGATLFSRFSQWLTQNW